MQNRICILPKDFNPRSCERSDLYNADGTLQIYEISIHAPARGATVAMGMMWIKSKFQSTLLREERLVSAACSNNIFNISIHAPARGATRKGCLQDRLFVFQSTLLREERRKSQSSHFTNELFQSTLLREERQGTPTLLLPQRKFQSTLLREERLTDISGGIDFEDFNPRSCERSDGQRARKMARANNFNPRSCERSDFLQIRIQTVLCDFNPRSCERSDSKNHVFLSK